MTQTGTLRLKTGLAEMLKGGVGVIEPGGATPHPPEPPARFAGVNPASLAAQEVAA